MFENFTFGAVSQTRHDESIASPTDLSFPTPRASFQFSPDTLEDLNDIVQQFSRQSLSRGERVREFAAWGDAITIPLEVDDSEDEMPALAPTASAPTSPYMKALGGSISCRRMQRQLNTQLQLSSSHIRDINTLVEDMISTNSQCRLQQRSSRTNMRGPISPLTQELTVDPMDDGRSDNCFDIDEGFCFADLSGEDEMSLRRASAPSGIRKHGPTKYSRSADVSIGGRAKVRSTPRMRKRSVVK